MAFQASTSFVHRALALLAVATAPSYPATASADSQDLTPTLKGIELVFPDVRLEVGAQAHAPGLILSWPIGFLAGWWQFGTYDEFERRRPYFITVQPFAEPQWRPGTEAVRLVAGARSIIGRFDQPLELALEYAGLVGTDGSGGLVGLGVLWAVGRGGLHVVTLGLVVRGVATTDDRRLDIVVDFQWPLNQP